MPRPSESFVLGGCKVRTRLQQTNSFSGGLFFNLAPAFSVLAYNSAIHHMRNAGFGRQSAWIPSFAFAEGLLDCGNVFLSFGFWHLFIHSLAFNTRISVVETFAPSTYCAFALPELLTGHDEFSLLNRNRKLTTEHEKMYSFHKTPMSHFAWQGRILDA